MGMLEVDRVEWRTLITFGTNREAERSSAGGNQIYMVGVIRKKTSIQLRGFVWKKAGGNSRTRFQGSLQVSNSE